MARPKRLSTRRRPMSSTALRDNDGRIRPEQKKAARDLVRLGKRKAKPFVSGVKRIFKSTLNQTRKKAPIDAILEHKKRLKDAKIGKF